MAVDADPRRLLAGQVLAMTDAARRTLEEQLGMRAAGIPLEAAVSRATFGRPREGLASLRIFGLIQPRASFWTAWFGGTPLDQFRDALAAAVADRDVSTILLHVDSGGGFVGGVMETAAAIRAAGRTKPIVAAVDGMAGSAAYWLAAQATKILITPSGEVGSIGVVAAHVDVSRLDERLGVKVTYVHAAPYKVEGNPHEPLGDDARAYLQRQVDEVYDDFVRDVSGGRGVAAARVKRDFGQGRMVMARDAVRLGMADAIASFDSVVASLDPVGPVAARTASGDEDLQLQADGMRMALELEAPVDDEMVELERAAWRMARALQEEESWATRRDGDA